MLFFEMLLISVATAAVKHVAFSCDSPLNATAGDNVYSATNILRTGDHNCGDCPGAANVSECWEAPASVWGRLRTIPAGRRSISFEGSESMYYCQQANGTRWWMDRLDDGSNSPWGDEWEKAVTARFSAWFAEYARIGGQVDVILSDFESMSRAYWYAFAHQAQSKTPQAALVRDSRWPKLRGRLEAAGTPFNASFSDLSGMQQWSLHDSRALVWDLVVVDHMTGERLNRSVYEPIRAHFPTVALSNFAHNHHTDVSGILGPSPAGGRWPYETDSVRNPLGTGSHVGTHQSMSVYGTPNHTTLIATSTNDRVRTVAASAFGMLLHDTMMMRDAHLAAPHVPMHPWISPKYALGGYAQGTNSWSWLCSGGEASNPGADVWQENVMHAALASGASTFLWWRPGAQRPVDVGMALMSSVLSELDNAIGTAGGAVAGGGCDGATPLANLSTIEPDDPYLLSGVVLDCKGSSSIAMPRRLYRLTPRCMDEPACASRPSPSDLRAGSAAILRVFSGFVTRVVPDGCWWSNQRNSSAVGFWIRAPC
jgi:hypothetical protein